MVGAVKNGNDPKRGRGVETRPVQTMSGLNPYSTRLDLSIYMLTRLHNDHQPAVVARARHEDYPCYMHTS